MSATSRRSRSEPEVLDDVLGAVVTHRAGERPLVDVRHAELYRVWADGAPGSWRLRAFGGDDNALLDLEPTKALLDDLGAICLGFRDDSRPGTNCAQIGGRVDHT